MFPQEFFRRGASWRTTGDRAATVGAAGAPCMSSKARLPIREEERHDENAGLVDQNAISRHGHG